MACGPSTTATAETMAKVPYRVEVTASAGALQERYSALPAGQGSGEVATVGGRAMLRREMGKVAFFTLSEWTGSVQLFAGASWTQGFAELLRVSLGDWLRATGEVVRTRTGELSVRVESWSYWRRPGEPLATSGAASRTLTCVTANAMQTCGPTHVRERSCWRAAGQLRHCGGFWKGAALSK